MVFTRIWGQKCSICIFFWFSINFHNRTNRGRGSSSPMLKIKQNWGKIANYTPNAQQRSAPLVTSDLLVVAARYVFFFPASIFFSDNLKMTSYLTNTFSFLFFVKNDLDVTIHQSFTDISSIVLPSLLLRLLSFAGFLFWLFSSFKSVSICFVLFSKARLQINPRPEKWSSIAAFLGKSPLGPHTLPNVMA